MHPSRRLDARPAVWSATLALLLLVLMVPTDASAHAALVDSDPADGAELAALPDAIVLTFNEPVEAPGETMVLTTGTEQVELDVAAGPDVGQLEASVPPGIAAGTHQLAWRAISDDGHLVEGSLTFTTTGPGSDPSSPEEDTDAVAADEDAAAEEPSAPEPAEGSDAPDEVTGEPAVATGASQGGDEGGVPPLLAGLGAIALAGVAAALILRRGSRRGQQPVG